MTRTRPSLLIVLLLTLVALALAVAGATDPSTRGHRLPQLEMLGGTGGGLLQIDELGVSTTISSHEFSVTGAAGSGGSGTGKAVFSPLKMRKAIDSSSPSLMQAVATGVHLPTAVVTVYKPDTTRALAVYQLEEVTVSGVEQTGAKANAETVSLLYRAITFIAGGESMCFDVVAYVGC